MRAPDALAKQTQNPVSSVIMPLTSQPAADGPRINGLADIVATAFSSPQRLGAFTVGAND